MSNNIALKERLATSVTTTGAQTAINGRGGYKTYSAWGSTSSGAGSTTILIEGSNSDGAAWVTIGTIALTLSSTVVEDGFTSADSFESVRAKITAISGTGATVNAAQSH